MPVKKVRSMSLKTRESLRKFDLKLRKSPLRNIVGFFSLSRWVTSDIMLQTSILDLLLYNIAAESIFGMFRSDQYTPQTYHDGVIMCFQQSIGS